MRVASRKREANDGKLPSVCAVYPLVLAEACLDRANLGGIRDSPLYSSRYGLAPLVWFDALGGEALRRLYV